MIGNHDNDDRPGNYKVDMPEASFFTGPKESNLRTVSRLKDFQGKKIWQPGLDVWSQKNERCTCVGSLWGRKWRMSWTLSHHSDCSLATTLNGDDGDGHHSDYSLMMLTMLTLYMILATTMTDDAKTWSASSGPESGPFLTSGLADSRGSEL